MFDRAIYILMGMSFAAFWGIGNVAWYGVENLVESTWLEPVFWALAASGILLLVSMDLYEFARRSLKRLERLARRKAHFHPAATP